MEWSGPKPKVSTYVLEFSLNTGTVRNLGLPVVRRLPERLVAISPSAGRPELEQTNTFLDASVLADPTNY